MHDSECEIRVRLGQVEFSDTMTPQHNQHSQGNLNIEWTRTPGELGLLKCNTETRIHWQLELEFHTGTHKHVGSPRVLRGESRQQDVSMPLEHLSDSETAQRV